MKGIRLRYRIFTSVILGVLVLALAANTWGSIQDGNTSSIIINVVAMLTAAFGAVYLNFNVRCFWCNGDFGPSDE